MVKQFIRGSINMVRYDKVIRIDIDVELYQDEISYDVTEWWIDYDDLLERPLTLAYIKEYYEEELEALKNKEIDYIALSCDL